MKKEDVFKKLDTAINTDKRNPQLSERSINETLDTLMPLVKEEESLDDFVERIEPIFKSLAGNLRKDVSEIARKLKEEADSKKAKKKDDEENDDVELEEDDDENEEGSMLKLIQTLTAEVKGLKESNEKRERGLTAESIKKDLMGKAGKIYPTAVIDVASLDFDFSVEDASDKFEDKLGFVAGKMNVKPASGKPDGTPDFAKLHATLKANEDFKNY